MKTLNFNDVVFEIIAHYENIPLQGNLIDSGFPDTDNEIISHVQSRLDNGEVWAWCTVEVKGTYRGVIVASDYLGDCSYEDQDDFINSSGYYKDMQHNVIRLIQDQLDLVMA